MNQAYSVEKMKETATDLDQVVEAFKDELLF